MVGMMFSCVLFREPKPATTNDRNEAPNGFTPKTKQTICPQDQDAYFERVSSYSVSFCNKMWNSAVTNYCLHVIFMSLFDKVLKYLSLWLLAIRHALINVTVNNLVRQTSFSVTISLCSLWLGECRQGYAEMCYMQSAHQWPSTFVQ